MIAAPHKFRIGINYWPSVAALRWWQLFDAGVVATDFGRIASAGFDSVRLFLTWETFQPTPDHVDGEMLDRLLRTADLAAAAGLTIMPTLFTGHMSGVNLVPGWAVGAPATDQRFRVLSAGRVAEGQPRNWYDQNDIVVAQTLLAGTCASALADHPALWAWDLGNENSNCAVPENPAQGREWLRRVTDAIRRADPTTSVTIGLHMEDLESDRHLGPADAATVCDFLSMHGYPIYAPWASGPTDDRLLGFLTRITRWLGGDTNVLFSEFGLPTIPPGVAAGSSPMLVEEQVSAAYTARALHEIRQAGATGAMLWCANDYPPAVWADPPFDTAHHERHFGQWRPDGSPKPAVATIAAYQGSDIMETEPELAWIDIEPAEFYRAGGSHLARLYGRYRAMHTVNDLPG